MFEKTVNQINIERYDLDKRLNEVERYIQNVSKENTHDIEQTRQVINMNLSQKVEFKDLDQVQRYILKKADIEKVQELVAELRKEIVTQVKDMKKEITLKKKKNEVDN